jgi:hypothetical protein
MVVTEIRAITMAIDKVGEGEAFIFGLLGQGKHLLY